MKLPYENLILTREDRVALTLQGAATWPQPHTAARNLRAYDADRHREEYRKKVLAKATLNREQQALQDMADLQKEGA